MRCGGGGDADPHRKELRSLSKRKKEDRGRMGRFYWRGSESGEGLGGNIASPLSFGGGEKRRNGFPVKLELGFQSPAFGKKMVHLKVTHPNPKRPAPQVGTAAYSAGRMGSICLWAMGRGEENDWVCL